MVVEHLDPVQTLIGIIGIAILFAVRKYLMTDSDDMTPHQKSASEESSKSFLLSANEHNCRKAPTVSRY